MSKIQHY